MINDKTVLRLQKATGLPVSRGVDKTINSMLDQLDDLKKNNPETKNDELASGTIKKIDCECENVVQEGAVEEIKENSGENESE